MKKGDKKKKYKCNGCSATERSENPRLAWHTSKCEGVTTKINNFASKIYHLSQGESAIRKAAVADVKADDADMLKERALKTDGILKNHQPPARSNSGSTISTLNISLKERKSPSDVKNAVLERFGYGTVAPGVKATIDQAVFEHIALTNKPFSESSSITFRRIFKVGVPGYIPPSAEHIGGKFLDANYDTLRAKVVERILACSHATIIMDGYADGDLNAIVNVLLRVFDTALGEAETYFWRNRHVTKHQAESGEFVANIIKETQEEIDLAYDEAGVYPRNSPHRLRIIAATGDRAANERLGRNLACQKQFIKFDLPCLAHGLHNLVKMICSSENIPEFAELIAETQQFVKDVMSKRTIKAAFLPYLLNQKVLFLKQDYF
jgi:hypothetical protein